MHPAVSPNGKLLFFVSDKAGGLGGTDIYVSRKQKNRWSRPENLGAKINTSGHEGFPFMHQNGKLYFCSKGHLGLGGFDVFVSQLDENGEWMEPTNLGSPINSPSDDISIFISQNEERGLFTSSREGGDDDIFLVSFTPKAIAINHTIEATTPITESPKEINTDKILAETRTEDKIEVLEISEKAIKKKIPINQTKVVELIKPAIIEKPDFLKLYELKNKDLAIQESYSLPQIKFYEGAYFVTFKIAKALDCVLLKF